MAKIDLYDAQKGSPATCEILIITLHRADGITYQKVIDLIYFIGYSHEETAKILNIPLGTVKPACVVLYSS